MTPQKLQHESDKSGVAAPGRAAVTFAGVLPPPLTGLSAMTAVIIDALRQRGSVRCINWSRGKTLKRWKWRLARGWGAIRTIATLFVGGGRPGDTFYYCVNRGGGLTYDLLVVRLARALDYRVVLHHHVYSYIDQYDWRAARLMRWAHIHVVHCEQMRDDLRRQYETSAEFWFVPPTIVSQQLGTAPRTPHAGFVLGYLSNVMMAKGIDEAVWTFERLADEGRDVRMIIAGPCKGRAERELIDATVAKWPARVAYRGPVYGAEKAQFFAEIDAFLFPTRYATESWGIVVTEALAAGRPVIARSRGCIPWIIDGQCGLIVARDAEYVAAAAALIKSWMDSPHAYRAAQQAALRRTDALQADASRLLPEFVRRMFQPVA